jgi:ParB-like chromosome segregation protein Spo0J
MTRLEVVQAPLGDLRPYPGNARRHDVDAIAGSLRVNGQFRPLVVQRGTSHVLVGNGTLQAAQRLGWPSVQVTYLDVDDAAARRIVLADNRTHDLGGYDEPALADLLSELDGFDGTGYAEEDLTDLLAALEPEEPTALIPEGREPRERTSRDRPEYEESYSSVSTRFIPLNYPLAQYVWLTDALAKIAEEEGVDGPEGAVLRLVELRVLEHAPTPETEAATA